MRDKDCRKNEYGVVILCTVGNVNNVLEYLPLWNAFILM